MSETPKHKYYFIYRNKADRLFSEVLTFGLLLFSFWFNQHFLESNNWVDLILFILFWIGIVNLAKKHAENNRMTVEEFYERFPSEQKKQVRKL